MMRQRNTLRTMSHRSSERAAASLIPFQCKKRSSLQETTPFCSIVYITTRTYFFPTILPWTDLMKLKGYSENLLQVWVYNFLRFINPKIGGCLADFPFHFLQIYGHFHFMSQELLSEKSFSLHQCDAAH
ncbi:hypothetical protein SAY86_017948 [Trapa natans]|uniref:Uncharacterized protein n=1 Tax=Trapa natans TaxID=22666 RepID=A0AAN7LS65_TRANT|nr:hypothetical protein SAY86_017948 [Trapa natans]